MDKSLFQPYTFNNGVCVKNRLVVAPMTHFASTHDGNIGIGERRFLHHRAEGFGLFVTAATLVSPEGKAFIGQPYAVGGDNLDSLLEVAEILHEQGAKAILQIHHGGKKARKDLLDGREVLAPSDDEESGARAMSDEEIRRVIGDFACAADLAIQAGFDGVEIHGANGYLLQQFYSAQSNRRNDEWGGSREKRMRFPLAVIEAVNEAKVRRACPEFIVGYRFSPEEAGENGLTMEDAFALVDVLVNQPLQYLHVSLWEFGKKARRGADTSRTRMDLLHERINGRLPLIGVGNLLSAAQIEQAMDSGWAEFVAVGKAVLMNPDLVSLLENGRGSQVVTELDLNRPDHYGIPDYLWQLCQSRPAFLPPVKGDGDWKPVDA